MLLNIYDRIFSNVSSAIFGNVPILYPLKTPENQRFSGFFGGYKIGTLARNELMAKSRWLSSLNDPSQIYDRVLNTSLFSIP